MHQMATVGGGQLFDEGDFGGGGLEPVLDWVHGKKILWW